MRANAIRIVCPVAVLGLLVITLASPPVWATPQPQRFSVGTGLGVLELSGLQDLWGLAGSEQTARLILGIVEFDPIAGLGARFCAGFGLLQGQSLLKFDTELLLNLPLHGARAYFGGGSGLLRYGEGLNLALQLTAGLKKDLWIMKVFMDAKLLLVLQLSGGPLFLSKMPFQFSPGVMLYF